MVSFFLIALPVLTCAAVVAAVALKLLFHYKQARPFRLWGNACILLAGVLAVATMLLRFAAS